MPSNPMQKKITNSFIMGILIMLIVAILIGAILFFLVIKPKITMVEKQKQEYQTVYKLKETDPRTGKLLVLESGETITSSMVELVEIPKQTNSDYVLANESAVGYKSKIQLQGNTILTYSMLYEDEATADSLRYTEYNAITIPTQLSAGNYVDIRLRLPNSQDLIVVSKKQIQNICGQTIGLNLKEEEIVVLNSALVEAYIMAPSAELYVTKYVEPGIQETATSTYKPTQEVLALIEMDNNIVDQAKETLRTLYARDDVNNVRQNVDSTRGLYSENALNNIEMKMQEQVKAAQKAREDYLSELSGE